MHKTSLLCLLLSLLPVYGGAAETPPQPGHPPARIAIIIDDIGDNLGHGLRALRLPGAITYSFLPHTAYAHELAVSAHKRGKEVMLHLPMESEDGRAPGPGALTLGMNHGELTRTFQADMAAIPYAAGVNNHMGSLITPQPELMSWLMQEILRHDDLFFVDSRTTEATVAQRVAQESGVPNLHRDVFLDNDQDAEAIARQFSQLQALAIRRGSAVAIAHPYPATLRFLEERLPLLIDQGIQLVSVSQLIKPNPKAGTLFATTPIVVGTAKGPFPPKASPAPFVDIP